MKELKALINGIIDVAVQTIKLYVQIQNWKIWIETRDCNETLHVCSVKWNEKRTAMSADGSGICSAAIYTDFDTSHVSRAIQMWLQLPRDTKAKNFWEIPIWHVFRVRIEQDGCCKHLRNNGNISYLLLLLGVSLRSLLYLAGTMQVYFVVPSIQSEEVHTSHLMAQCNYALRIHLRSFDNFSVDARTGHP